MYLTQNYLIAQLNFILDKMEISINNTDCLMCNGKKLLTKHHAIPSNLKPLNNILITLCDTCHKKIHGSDTRSVSLYALRIMHETKQNMNNIKNKLDKISKSEFKKV